MPRDSELRTAFGVEPYENYGGVYDDDLAWREEAFGERPVLGPWGDPFHGPESDDVAWTSTRSASRASDVEGDSFRSDAGRYPVCHSVDSVSPWSGFTFVTWVDESDD